MPSSLVSVSALRFVGGLGVLDFLNTCNGRRPDTSLDVFTENLQSMDDVINWFHCAKLIDRSELICALDVINNNQSESKESYQQVVKFREELFSIFFDLAEGRPVNSDRLATINDAIVNSAPLRSLMLVGLRAIWTWSPVSKIDDLVKSLIGRLAIQAAELVTSPDLSRVKCCGSLTCDWLFMDTSKNGQRRWCQMSVCGSKEKASRARGHNS